MNPIKSLIEIFQLNYIYLHKELTKMPAIITIIQHHSRIYSTTIKMKQVVQTSERKMKFIICTGYNGKVRKSKKATEVLKSVKGGCI